MACADEKLNQLFDNELSPDEAESLRAKLDAQDQAKLHALEALSQTVRTAVLTEAAAHKIDLWAQLEDRLEDSAPHNVVPLRRKVFLRAGAVVSALAFAAGLLSVFRPPAAVQNQCEVEELEVVGSGATVFKVADDRGSDTTLIWFDHQEEDEWESL